MPISRIEAGMKAEPLQPRDIIAGRVYQALVAGKVEQVRVEAIEWKLILPGEHYRFRDLHVYRVTNLRNGRRLLFRSAARFRPLEYRYTSKIVFPGDEWPTTRSAA
jgi:hypothetical protein